uniref:Uncharacterized protein n=1 Tax=Anguilla anguilla TaxID=7936 RepID=A0A0E9WA89_ANGAN
MFVEDIDKGVNSLKMRS